MDTGKIFRFAPFGLGLDSKNRYLLEPHFQALRETQDSGREEFSIHEKKVDLNAMV